MKNVLFYYLLASITLFATSCSEDEVEDEYENVGTVAGTWAFQQVTTDVETSGTSLSLVVNPLLETALQTYAGTQEPSYYVFDDGSSFESYVTDLTAENKTGAGTYSLSGNTLTLVYSETSETVTFEIAVLSETTLKIKKDYKTSYVEWGAGVLESYTGVSVASAISTMTYTKQ